MADYSNHTIRKVTPAGVVTTLAGLAGSSGSADGTGSAARFYYPTGVAVDSAGNVYVADHGQPHDPQSDAGGSGDDAGRTGGQFWQRGRDGQRRAVFYPDGVAVDSAGNVYVADTRNYTIRKVTPAGVVTTLAGLAGSSGSADGTGSAARFYYPAGVAVDSTGNVYVADTVQRHDPQSDAGGGGDDAGRTGGQFWQRGRDGQRRAVYYSYRRGGGQRRQRLCGGLPTTTRSAR